MSKNKGVKKHELRERFLLRMHVGVRLLRKRQE